MNRLAVALTFAAFCASPISVHAHQLDEYLQASRLAVSRDRIVVEIALTPGASIAARVWSALDGDGDSRVSPVELARYGRRVMQDISLSVDGEPLQAVLVRAEAPTWDEMREGAGTIRLEAAVRAALDRGSHRIRFENSHESRESVYLVNALVPADRTIDIPSQRRDRLQRGIDLDVTIAGTAPAMLWFALLCGVTMAPRIVASVRRR